MYNVALLAEGVGRNTRADLMFMRPASVALLAEGVGRNHSGHRHHSPGPVALLAEGVGRNLVVQHGQALADVTLLAEGVGRNKKSPGFRQGVLESPSSRRAWVEIVCL